MRMNIISGAVILAAANAINIQNNERPIVSYFTAPSSPYIHSLFCKIYGEDPDYPPCDSIDKLDFTPYEKKHDKDENDSLTSEFEKFMKENSKE